MRKHMQKFWLTITIFVASDALASMTELADRAYQRGAPLVMMMHLRDTMTLTPGPCHGPANQLTAADEKTTASSQRLQAAAWLSITQEPVILASPRTTPVPLAIKAFDATGKELSNRLIATNGVIDPITFSSKMTKASWIFLQMESNEITNEGNWRQWLEQVILLPESQFKRFGTIPFRRVQLTRDTDAPSQALFLDGLAFFKALNRALYENPGLIGDWRNFAVIGVQANPARSLGSIEPEIREILRKTPARNPAVKTSWQRSEGCW